MKFTWDTTKAKENERKHGVSFREAMTAFADERALDDADLEHADRAILIGMSSSARVLFVVFQPRSSEHVHIIHARPASRRQRNRYADE